VTNGWYPDTGGNKTDPDYPYQSLPTTPAIAPTVAFQDFPNRYPSDGDQYWLAQLGLVCKNLTTHVCDIIDTFDWGFGVVANPAGVTSTAPFGWGAPTQNYIDTLTNAFNGQNGSTAWTFSTDCSNCCVPEPCTLVIWSLLCGLGIAFGRRIRRRTA
jgi:hypothetical protein